MLPKQHSFRQMQFKPVMATKRTRNQDLNHATLRNSGTITNKSLNTKAQLNFKSNRKDAAAASGSGAKNILMTTELVNNYDPVAEYSAIKPKLSLQQSKKILS